MGKGEKENSSGVPIEAIPVIAGLLEELAEGITCYWQIAGRILAQSNVHVEDMPEDYLSYKKNFFSLLFLYSYSRYGIPRSRRVLYATILQCQRGMVTGCDNILDDEYKQTLHTSLPKTGYKFRSVIDIMVSDRVLFDILFEAAQRHEIEMEKVVSASAASMKTMTESGVQEASEEEGITTIIPPEDVLNHVHHYKTGILFQCPWDIPQLIESPNEELLKPFLGGLYRIGMGCQIFDDIVDIESDIRQRRHNYLCSYIHHLGLPEEKDRLQEVIVKSSQHHMIKCDAADYPHSTAAAILRAHSFLESGFHSLLAKEHSYLTQPFIDFLEKRIGTVTLGNVAL